MRKHIIVRKFMLTSQLNCSRTKNNQVESASGGLHLIVGAAYAKD